jgi:hypothetical protein
MEMPPFEDDDIPTMRELHRTLRDFRDEFRGFANLVVRKDVHEVEHKTVDTRLSRLEIGREEDRKERAAVRNQFYFSVLGAGLSLMVALLTAWAK